MNRRNIKQEVLDEALVEIPKIIIDMLPDTPQNLFKYARRVKNIQYSANINEEIKTLMNNKLLTDKEYLKTFYYTMAITFFNKSPVDSPKISIVAAQTGSGKSNLTAKILRKDSNYIFIDSDKYKHFRYDATDIANNYQVLYPYLTAPDSYDCADNIYKYAVNNKYNIIKETAPSKNKGLLGVDIKELLDHNYSINVNILAVGKLNSMLSLHERYEKQIICGLKTAKLTNLNRHDESYNSLIDNVEDIYNNKNISEINVFIRGKKETNFNPVLIYPSNNYKTPIDAINGARIIDNNITKEFFSQRYKLILKQMNNRNALKEQFEQLGEIKNRFENNIYI